MNSHFDQVLTQGCRKVWHVGVPDPIASRRILPLGMKGVDHGTR
jgi:hypothetical protein